MHSVVRSSGNLPRWRGLLAVLAGVPSANLQKKIASERFPPAGETPAPGWRPPPPELRLCVAERNFVAYATKFRSAWQDGGDSRPVPKRIIQVPPPPPGGRSEMCPRDASVRHAVDEFLRLCDPRPVFI